MHIGILGDIHDNRSNLEQVLSAMRPVRPGAILCLGDLTEPAVLVPIAEAFPGIPIHLVSGNSDSEESIKCFIDKESLDGVHYHHLTGRLKLDDKRIAFTHKPRHAEVLLQEDFDVICFGHTHEPRLLSKEDTLLVNPGDVQGRFGERPGYAVYDTASGRAELKKV
ncbi:MAG: metallophosphatase family protein [bacterium]|nr:metallophosphatase family protein [bacterium]